MKPKQIHLIPGHIWKNKLNGREVEILKAAGMTKVFVIDRFQDRNTILSRTNLLKDYERI